MALSPVALFCSPSATELAPVACVLFPKAIVLLPAIDDTVDSRVAIEIVVSSKVYPPIVRDAASAISNCPPQWTARCWSGQCQERLRLSGSGSCRCSWQSRRRRHSSSWPCSRRLCRCGSYCFLHPTYFLILLVLIPLVSPDVERVLHDWPMPCSTNQFHCKVAIHLVANFILLLSYIILK